jgi:PAS domain S-box-containing protein
LATFGTETALNESEARFRAFFDNAMVGMATSSPDKDWTQVNPALCRILGYSRAELATTTWAALTHADDLPADIDHFNRLICGEIDQYSVKKRFIRRDGQIVHAFVTMTAVRKADGSVDFFAATIEDISERRATAQLLKEQHDFDRCLIENSPMGILTYREDGQCVLANDAATRITGGSREKLLHQNFHHIESWHKSGLLDAARQVFLTNTSLRTTVHHVSTFGRDSWMECTMSIVTTRGERHLLLIVNDVSERVQAENRINETVSSLRETNRRLEEAHHQLLQSEKLASLGQLAAGVAHELNNPIGFVHSNLGSLSSYVDDLLRIDAACGEIEAAVSATQPQLFAGVRELKQRCDHAFVVEDLRHLVDESLEGLDRMRKIVQDLKDFSRVGDTGWQWADLHKGIDSTLNIVWNEVKYKADVDRQYGELPEVRCIPSQLNQVFMNLLVNAAQAIEERGRIAIRTHCDGTHVVIEVQDTGSGIPPENLQRIFEPFFTTKPVGKGTGLGLSLSWGIVQRHKGSIEVRSESGQGSTFRVTLPIDAGPSDDVPQRQDAS